jgi:hypothetical protein
MTARPFAGAQALGRTTLRSIVRSARMARFAQRSSAGRTTTLRSIVRPARLWRSSNTVSFPHSSSSPIPGNVHGFNGPSFARRRAALSGRSQPTAAATATATRIISRITFAIDESAVVDISLHAPHSSSLYCARKSEIRSAKLETRTKCFKRRKIRNERSPIFLPFSHSKI